MEPKAIKSSVNGGPYAVKTPLGWVLNGPFSHQDYYVHHRKTNFIQSEDALSAQFKAFCNMEFSDTLVGVDELSQYDQKAVQIMQESAILKNGHYEISLPWKDDNPCLPNNRSLAELRLVGLKKRFKADPESLKKYSNFMSELLEKGYAERVPEENTTRDDGLVWYLPHHSVFNPRKPEKTRVVFDCSAKYHGISLNDKLLQGPDLTNNLIGVLTRFRQEPIAMTSDIEAMFMQVHVNPEHRDALRFLWWPKGEDIWNVPPEEYRMTVHLFGAVSSPTCSNFALKKTADDNQELFEPDILNTVRHCFYVDDCLKSVETEKEAIKTSSELCQLLKLGGFNLTKWIANSRNVLESIPGAKRAETVKVLDQQNLPIDRVLGMEWNTESDELGFKVMIKDKPITRQGILSIVSSTYDPLGLASPFVLPAKIILQDLCRMRLGWDEKVSGEPLYRWEKWLLDLPRLSDFAVNRCVKPANFGDIISSQLHHFSDAAETGYGSVTYLRQVNASGEIHCSLMMSKSRVTPLKQISIPRLELSAAVVSTRLDQIMKKELTIPLESSTFWTDSTAVIRYVENEDKRFHTFVANRIAKIRDVSLPEQWRYVDTNRNPGDYTSRGLSADSLIRGRWLMGPKFLWQSEDQWPVRPASMRHISQSDPEVRDEKKTCVAISQSDHNIEKILEKFSTWWRMKKCIAWILRYKTNLHRALQQRQHGQPVEFGDLNSIQMITLEEMNNAEKVILKHTQKWYFSEELEDLNAKKRYNSQDCGDNVSSQTVKSSSRLRKLSPIIKDGLICVGGRLERATIPEESKHQVILPNRSHVTDLIIKHYHNLSGHSGREYVLSVLRGQFWVIKGNSAVRHVLSGCYECRKRYGSRGSQIMADLPEDRVKPNRPPFSSVGIDFFGPYLIKRGRSEVKRYGVIFTCLAIRAVHIEITHSLDTSSFLNALRRFIARRGQPFEIRTDNGGNFVSGEAELCKALLEWNNKKIHEFLAQHNVKWTFNPPLASHHGGVWERCIRTIRKVMSGLLKQQRLDDEGLVTIMCEVEAIINNRPITKVSDDPKDMGALTPNHLLMFREGPYLPPGNFVHEDLYSRRRWRQIQYMADQFWLRWIKEYLPLLQERQKWFSKSRNLVVGDLVLIVDENTPRGHWAKGLVKATFPDKQGIVRQVELKTAQGQLKRDTRKLCLLEQAENLK